MIRALTYIVTDIAANGKYTVVECENGARVNEYTGYEKNGIITLYPRRKIIPSSTLLDKKEISLQNTKKGF